MFELGQLIIYASRGVCRVQDIGPLDMEDTGDRVYYTLSPVYGKGTFYIPVDSNAFMRPIMTADEAESFINDIGDIKGDIYANKNMVSLKEHYATIVQSHDSEKLVQLIKGIWEKAHIAEKNGKHPAQIDKQFMEQAEELLYGELACSLGIPREEVVAYISDKINS